MPHIPTELVEKAKKMDLLTYLRRYEPQELVRVSRRVFTTKTHDSLKISNGLWMWWSQGIGGRTALEYLIKVRGLPFVVAVQTILDHTHNTVQQRVEETASNEERLFLLPRAAATNEIAIDYLKGRGIAMEVLDYCIANNLLYESKRHHNVVFVGYDDTGTARYAALRSTAIDLLSYATLMQMENKDWRSTNLLSLAGVSVRKKGTNEAKLPAALEQFLHVNPQIQTIHLHLDRDAAGRNAAEALTALLSEHYKVANDPPLYGKDINDDLCRQLSLPNRIRKERREER